MSRKRLHAAANKDVLQGDHWEHSERYAGEHRYSKQPGSHAGSLNAGGDCEKLYLDEEVSAYRGAGDGQEWHAGVCEQLG